MSRRLALIASLVLFALACALPAVDFDQACSTEGEPELAKLGQAPLGKVETSRGLWLLAALAALVLAAISLLLTNMWPLPADEGGVCHLSAIAPQLGYWLWLFAIVALCVAAFRPDAGPPAPPAR